MTKYLIPALIAVSLFASLGLSSKTIADKNRTSLIYPTPTPLTEIERLESDKTEALYACICYGKVIGHPNGCGTDENGEIKKDNFLIAIKTFVRNPKKTALIYEYTASGGQIIGEGDKVTWNLEGSRPGTYTITASIKGKRGISTETKSQSVIVKECDCNCPCVCPTLDVSGGGGVKAGETVTFEANISGGTETKITFNWTVSQGEIIEGQWTPKITVKAAGKVDEIIKATVELRGDGGFCYECPNLTGSETAFIIK
jgi:hypothetical protein